MMIVRNLVRRPLRTLFTTAGVLIGTAAYIAIVSLSEGMRQQSQRVIDSLGTDITVTRARSPVPWMSWLTPEEVESLRGLSHVASVSGVVVGTTRSGPRQLFLVFGADSRQPLVRTARFVSGRVFRPGSSEVAVGDAAAVQLDVKPGDQVEIAGAVLEVVGVFSTGRGLLDASAVVDLPLAQSLFGANDRVNIAFVNARTAADLPPLLAEIRTKFPRLEATQSAEFTSRFAYLDLVTAYARAFALLALVLAAVMIANTVGMNVNERRQEIALLRSIGWQRARIAALIAGETALMIGVGALLGIPCAAAALRLLGHGDVAWIVPATLAPANAVEGVLLALAVGLFFALVPIADALRRRPAEALRNL